MNVSVTSPYSTSTINGGCLSPALICVFMAGATPWDEPPQFTGCFYVHPDSVQAVYEQVKDKIVCEFGVEEREWGARELTVSDPDGYFVTFTEPL